MSDPTSPYHTYVQYVRYIGSKNNITASNKDVSNASSADLDSIQDSYNVAADMITAKFSSSNYVSPLDFTPNKGIVPAYVGRWAMQLAYADQLASRGLESSGKKDTIGGRVLRLVQDAFADMTVFTAGIRYLPAATVSGSQGMSVVGCGGQSPFIYTQSPVYLLGDALGWNWGGWMMPDARPCFPSLY